MRLINGLLAGVLLLHASSAQATLRVVTTTTDLKALVEAVGGEHVRVGTRQRELDALVAPDGRAEDLALLRVGRARLDEPLRVTDALGCD